MGNVEEKDRSTNANNTWIIWSDRTNNATFEDKECTKEKGKLTFLQACYVVEDTETAIHIMKYDQAAYNSDTRKLDNANPDYGWIQKDKMLLWKKGLVTEKNKFRR